MGLLAPSARTRFVPPTRRRAASIFRSMDVFIVGYPVSVFGLVNAIQLTFVSLPTLAFR